ncbi:MAG: hypothetical protein ACI89X_000741 [Planctomycetota bacterium]|jgi:uncharacterized protein (TIGR00369 family)
MIADFAATPCNRWLGFELIARSDQRVEIAQPVREEMLQETGVVQGGLLTALADTAAVYLLWPDLGCARTMTGTTVSMQFLSGAIAGAQPLRAIAVPLRVGRTVAVCECCVHQGDRLVAKGTFTFLLRDKR